MVSPLARRRAARYLVEAKKCSTNCACRALRLSKSTYYRQGAKPVQKTRVERRIVALSRRHPRYGYRLITALLREEGFSVNRKRVQRVRRREQLQVAAKSRKTRRARPAQAERVRAERRGQVWSFDFVHDQLENGISLKMLTVLDECTRECLGILVARSITASGVIAFLELLMLRHGAPENVRSDNGPEFVAQAVQDWAGKRSITVNYITPGSPWENGHVESFHGKFRDGCLNRESFGSLLEAQVVIEEWRQQYNEKRPHSALGYQTPQAFGRQFDSPLRVATLPSAGNRKQ